MADLIKLLPDSVANQIAAGEVIQRPASVVKELMENSVDSGASNITVVIKDSGRTLIQVTDDGCGMSETDARLSFERHSTSKITTAQDLFTIRTKGFRGEALASIAAVAMVELKTRNPESETGTRIVISGSKVEVQEPCSCPAGTGFSVKNLFFNIPARRKFLKSDNTETRHIITEFQKVVLAHPGIRFSLYHNDSEIYNLPQGNYKQRIIGVFGRQMTNDLIALDTETTLIKIKGFIGKPENARKTFGEQFFFVNDRFMKHPYFHKAVVEAYQNILTPDSIPSYFIYLETDPASIDINIHPTKTEIKFEDERAIWQIIMASVREALGRFNIVPSLDFGNEGIIDIPVPRAGMDMPGPPEISVNAGYNPFAGEERDYSQASFISRFENDRTGGWEKLYHGIENHSDNSPGQPVEAEHSRKFFQIRNRYIACPVKSGVMIIDQKRAHERILFERFLAIPDTPQGSSQVSLFPVRVNLNPADICVLREIDKELSAMGFNIEFNDDNYVVLKGLPPYAEAGDPSSLLDIIIEEFKNTQTDPSLSLYGKIAVAVSGAMAVPYGKPLSLFEMEDLFDTLFACASPNYSPKGKPVINILTLGEIDKRFQ
ncbi:MAG: DNA mismatch repair endonuclease MutL [Bacteroidales bacterium]|jgi:DNA mismatch repair protein MutL|nr:DNA mismatch repair endonuclease MutL [Bacteroidales bacterium]